MNLPVEMLKCLQFQEINSGLLGKYRSSGWLFFFLIIIIILFYLAKLL